MDEKKQQAFLDLYEPIHDRFERFCRARVYGDMDFRDLINETLLVAYDKLDSLKSKEAFLAFLFSIAVRLLANNKRKRKELALTDEKQANNVQDPNADSGSTTDVYMLHQALALLPENQRECLILFEISGFKVKEIAAMQNASEEAVRQRLKRGRDKLKQILTFESAHKTGEVQHGK